jgi:hypothetical protein
MRNPQEIISEFRTVLHWSQPNLKHDDMLALLNELESTLFPTEEVVVEEPIVETVVEEVVVEETVTEEPTVEVVVEETVTEEPTVEVVVPKTTTRKK